MNSTANNNKNLNTDNLSNRNKKENRVRTENRELSRPVFPKRAVITAGMPYGNKALHFGHIGGLFVHADTFARFMRDRIGEKNVIFVSGTDCYGSPISAGYKKLVSEGFEGSIEDYVMGNYKSQRETLKAYDIEPNLYGTSAFGRSGEIHEDLSNEIINKLYKNGFLTKLSTPQFYDEKEAVFLNGRQVTGNCPFEGCRSEKAYADECDMGHQYMPKDLVNPMSTLSGERPHLREVTNWYFKLDAYSEMLKNRMEYLKMKRETRSYIVSAIEEFLKSPIVYLKNDDYDKFMEICKDPSKYNVVESPGKNSTALAFSTLEDRDHICEILDELNIRFRKGKTLVPFRLTGNSEWGIPVPNIEELANLTFWVWPESLWAPISFTKAYLETRTDIEPNINKWWNSNTSKVYQFIGEDNIYFYGIAEMALFTALEGYGPDASIDWNKFNLPELVSNKHILYMDKKASSSGRFKPPMADDLLKYYTAEQLRIHFLSLGLARKSVSFSPQVYLEAEDRVGKDPVLKDGNLLTNVLNRLARSCFYTAQKHNNSKLPTDIISTSVLEESKKAVLDYEKFMYEHEFHRIIYVLDEYLRKMNKHWAKNMKIADENEDRELRMRTLSDGFHALRTAATLIHPIAPKGCELIAEHLGLHESLWDWDLVFSTLPGMVDMNTHHLKYLEPKYDFFKKHESQFATK